MKQHTRVVWCMLACSECSKLNRRETVNLKETIELSQSPFSAKPIRQKSCRSWIPGWPTKLNTSSISYNRLEGKQFKVLGQGGPKKARKLVLEGQRQFAKDRKKHP